MDLGLELGSMDGDGVENQDWSLNHSTEALSM